MRHVVLAAILLVSACVSTVGYPSSFAYKDVTVRWLGHSGFEITGSKKFT